MHPFDAASFRSAAPVEGSFEPRQEEERGGAASSPSSSPSRGTRAGGDDRDRAKAYCAHCCSDRGFVCPAGHVKMKTSHVPAHQQCSESQQTSPAAVDVEPVPKRQRRAALPSDVTAAAPTTTSSDYQPIATPVLEMFAREVRLDAVFRRVRLGGPDEPEVAYYTTVTIAGHVFRGLLYDAGPHSHSGSTSTAAASDTTDGSGEGEVGSSLSLSTAGGSGSNLDLTLGL